MDIELTAEQSPSEYRLEVYRDGEWMDYSGVQNYELSNAKSLVKYGAKVPMGGTQHYRMVDSNRRVIMESQTLPDEIKE